MEHLTLGEFMMKCLTFGEFIADKRRVADLTQKELAEKLGLTDKAVSKWTRDQKGEA
jgi:transcriptional regulator with XRE-family HTH domain